MINADIAGFIKSTILQLAHAGNKITHYREPLVGYVSADHPKFLHLQKIIHPSHKLPVDLLPCARSVVSFFLPFVERIVIANKLEKENISKVWVEAYLETNDLIEKITDYLIAGLSERGVQAMTQPPTGNFDHETLVSSWSHKSIAVIAGLGSFGLHQLVITDAGCAGRFGSLVLDVDLPITEMEPKQRCLYFVDGSCLECVLLCPVSALDQNEGLDKQLCWKKCQETAQEFQEMGRATVCGKCAVGVCAMQSST